MTSDTIDDFRIEVSDEEIDDLRARLRATRWPDQIPGSGWGYGTDLEYLRDLCEYWANTFDWRAQEARFNRWPHHRTEIDGHPVHFIHARSPEPDALPLLVTHGWPGSVAEFLDVIEPLRDPRAHGGDPAHAFHVVCPSIPGYGWSGPTREPGWDVRRVAGAWTQLMARLGYDRYGAQGGDWGSMISAQVGHLDPGHVVGVHLNMVVAFPPPDGGGELSEQEQQDLADTAVFLNEGSAYQQIHGKNPQTLGYGLTDSPAGLASWIVEKFHAWTDHDGNLEDAIDRDHILTNLSVYWFTRTINSSVRLYCESQRAGRFPPFDRVEVPVGCAIFPKELVRAPRSWAEHTFNVQRWTRFDRGGHFAALEEPDLLIDDVRAFFGAVRA
ncbi:MAG TPA: alpha/beta fold hydrolase [Acidimicrobiia bacterium]|nr:alpha/beta fold hydrolase [Acidimicrobiia bacterium]